LQRLHVDVSIFLTSLVFTIPFSKQLSHSSPLLSKKSLREISKAFLETWLAQFLNHTPTGTFFGTCSGPREASPASILVAFFTHCLTKGTSKLTVPEDAFSQDKISSWCQGHLNICFVAECKIQIVTWKDSQCQSAHKPSHATNLMVQKISSSDAEHSEGFVGKKISETSGNARSASIYTADAFGIRGVRKAWTEVVE
jgi:hypothetical protein